MPKIKLTKGELKRQRDLLGQFRHYLPTLQLKKQQLQMRIRRTRAAFLEKQTALEAREHAVGRWVGLLADPELRTPVDFKRWVLPEGVDLGSLNVAGAVIPVLERVRFREAVYDYFTTPFWIDKAVVELRAYFTLLLEREILDRQIAVLERELRVTTQRVNLFDKVMIPRCLDNIRRIRIVLGDQQANAVGIGKVAKRKLETAGAAA